MLPFAYLDMDTDDQNLRDTSERSRFSNLHARTFEGELLISGAVVFGLLQVPPLIARFFEEALIRLEGHLRLIAVYGLTYITLVVYGLIGAFLIHLILRAFWIGLVGLEGIVAFIALSDIVPGRHELVVLAPPRRSDRDDGDPSPTRHVIPFWR